MDKDPQSKDYPKKLIDIQRPSFQEERSFLTERTVKPVKKKKKSLKDYPAEQLIALILIIGSLSIAWILY